MHIALFSDNSPTVHWVRRLASRGSLVAMYLLRALAFWLWKRKSSPLTLLHISGTSNQMTDIPSRSYGSVKKWHCKTDEDLRNLYNSYFPLPKQAFWTVFHLSSKIVTKVTSILQTKVSLMDEWRQLPPPGTTSGHVGQSMSSLRSGPFLTGCHVPAPSTMT